MGFRCGFLGLLHMDVFQQRLADEEAISVILTAPSIPYVAALRANSSWSSEHLRNAPHEAPMLLPGGDADADATMPIDATMQHVMIENPQDLPPMAEVTKYYEPTAIVSVVAPASYMGAMMQLLESHGGCQQDVIFLQQTTPGRKGSGGAGGVGGAGGAGRVALRYLLPWREVVAGLHDSVKSSSAGCVDWRSAWQSRAPLRRLRRSPALIPPPPLLTHSRCARFSSLPPPSKYVPPSPLGCAACAQLREHGLRGRAAAGDQLAVRRHLGER
jgi:hypothetical protein